jgi:glutathione S-transferase
MTITLWGRDSSANVQKVRWALAELGLSYDHIPLGGKFGGNKTADYLAMNPNGLVPTIRDGDLILWESHAILRYLTATYGAGTLWPLASADRAVSDQWTDWTATTFQPAWLGVFWNRVRTPVEQQDSAKVAKGIEETENCLAMLDERLADAPFLGGAGLTYADIAAGIAMFRWSTMPIARKDWPNLARWHAGLRQREPFRAAVEIDYSEFIGRLVF